MMLEVQCVGWKQLPLHTHDVDRQWFAQNSQNEQDWTYFKNCILVRYYSWRHLESKICQTSRPLCPSRLPLCAHRERRLGTRQMHSGTSLLHYCVFTELCKWKILHICSSLKTCTPGLFFYLLHNFLSKHNIFSSGIMIFKQLCKYRPPPLSPISSPHPSQKNSIDDFNYSLNYCCSTGLLCGLWTIVIIDLICGCWTIFFPGNKNKYHI